MAYDIEKIAKAVEAYSKTKKLGATARKYSVNPSTLWRWVKHYYRLADDEYGRETNRRSMEHTVMMLKERHVDLTLHKAQNMLAGKGIHISIKKIYTIWKEYGLIARPPESPFSAYGHLTKESKKDLARVRLILRGNTSEPALRIAGKIISEMPSYPDNHESILRQIPDKYLSWRRRLDKIDADFTQVPKPVLYKKIKKIRRMLTKQNRNYSALLAGIFEILLMHWMRMPRAEIKLNKRLHRQKRNLREPVINLALSFLAGTAYSELLDFNNASRYIRKLQKLQKTLPNVQTYTLIGDLMTWVTDYGKAIAYYKKALSFKPTQSLDIGLRLKISLALAIAGEYRTVERCYFRRIGIRAKDHNYSTYSLIKALCAIGQGRIDRAKNWLQICLEKSEKEQLRNNIYTANSCLASIKCAFNQPKEARKLLKKVCQLQQKYRLARAVKTLGIILGGMGGHEKQSQIPSLRILNMLRRAKQTLRLADYYAAFQYARQKGQTGFLHRMIMFFPESVLALLKKGRPTHLPNSILRLPIFNKTAPVFQVKYLGTTAIIRNQQNTRIKLKPQEESLLIQIAQRAGEPGKSIDMDDITGNYWPKSKNPANRLAHVMVQLRRKLGIPKHALSTAGHAGARRISNSGFYATSDFDEFNLQLVQARALENLNELPDARQKYREALSKIRGSPCRDLYDNWADNQRRFILSRIEKTINSYKNLCRTPDGKIQADRAIQRLNNILHV